MGYGKRRRCCTSLLCTSIRFLLSSHSLPITLPPLPGEVVSLHHYVEAGSLQGPALLGSTVVLQDLVETFKSSPCTLRTLSSCICWQARLD